jgi:hypothetical protein
MSGRRSPQKNCRAVSKSHVRLPETRRNLRRQARLQAGPSFLVQRHRRGQERKHTGGTGNFVPVHAVLLPLLLLSFLLSGRRPSLCQSPAATDKYSPRRNGRPSTAVAPVAFFTPRACHFNGEQLGTGGRCTVHPQPVIREQSRERPVALGRNRACFFQRLDHLQEWPWPMAYPRDAKSGQVSPCLPRPSIGTA